MRCGPPRGAGARDRRSRSDWLRVWGTCCLIGAAATTHAASDAILSNDAGAAAHVGAASNVAGTVLDRYLAGLKSLRTDFTQTVTDAHGTRVDAGNGSLLLQRPGKFRWDYQPRNGSAAAGSSAPATATAAGDTQQRGQLLIADGKNLWFYDRELAQVTVKPVSAALSSTPIVLLSGSTDELRASFDVSAAGAHDGLNWVDVKPRSDEADFSDAQLGFKGDELARMIVHDSLGQTVQLDFSDSQRNGVLDAAAFEFKAPAGVDVLGTAQY